MEKILVEVSFTGKNYSAHIPILLGCVTTGCSLEEIKTNVKEIVPFHIEGMREDNYNYPSVFDSEYEFVYRLSTEALIKEFSGIFTKTALSHATGINQRQISHYVSGRTTPRPKQRERIIKGIHAISRELASVV
ncbi:MAG: type II toxin-antitoxin system HicB family antitoxin [Marinilabiliaceae bacterium]|nr:type II toxin-antitoxin system HicB family antitoxin [Marinilabiliaceae bacterium]